MPRKSQITMTPRADGVKTRNAVLARRLAGNVNGAGNRAIPLKEPQRWHTYIANTYVDENEFYRMRHELGWEPLTAEDLDCKVDESGFRLAEDGLSLVRGPKGQEMIFKMPIADWHELQRVRTEQNNKGIGSASKTRSDIAEAASGQLGGEAADYLSKLDGKVIDTITGGEAQ